MGERRASTEREQLLQRHRMRIRTVAVSFAAAVSSAHRDLAAGGAERDALIETWRAWSIRVLSGYAEEIAAIRAARGEGAHEDLAALESELADAIDAVRNA
jgi:hypothetical protein